MKDQRGMVLIAVLWVIAVLSFISLALAFSTRTELSASQTDFDSQRAFFMARGAAETVYSTVVVKRQDFPKSPRIRLENSEYIFSFDSGEVRVQLVSDSNRIDLNGASDELLASMFDSLGVDEQARNRLVDSVLDWRDADDIPHVYGAEVSDYPSNGSFNQAQGARLLPPNRAFQAVDELLVVRNVTPELYYGQVSYDSAVGKYRRLPGLRELATVSSGGNRVNVNSASLAVLMALPRMSAETARQILAERERKPFPSAEDLIERIPDLFGRETLNYMAFEPGPLTAVSAKATVFPSGTSRTVRLLFTRTQKQVITPLPLPPGAPPGFMVQQVEEVSKGRWQFQ